MFANFRIRRFSNSLVLSAAMLSVSSAVLAETTLTAVDGSVTITGELLGFENNAYRIRTAAGELLIRGEFVACSGDGCPKIEGAAAADGGEVTLSSSDDQINLKGALVGVTNTELILDTIGGRLTVRRELINCEGASCPSTKVKSDRFTVSVSDVDGVDLLTAIVGDYTAAKDFNLTQQLGSGDTQPTLLVGDEQGLEISRIDILQLDTAQAITALFGGESQFAITRERITPELLSTQLETPVTDIEQYLSEEVIGLDAIVFAVGESSGIDVISLETAQAVLEGRIKNWAQLGGADLPINLHAMTENDGLVQLLRTRGMSDLDSLYDATLHTSNSALNAAINDDPSAFGVMYRSQATDVKALNLVSDCNIFVDNSDFSIQTEEHPLAMRWYQYSLKEGSASEFARNVGRFIPTDFGQQASAGERE